jgi:hypothetical protein
MKGREEEGGEGLEEDVGKKARAFCKRVAIGSARWLVAWSMKALHALLREASSSFLVST